MLYGNSEADPLAGGVTMMEVAEDLPSHEVTMKDGAFAELFNVMPLENTENVGPPMRKKNDKQPIKASASNATGNKVRKGT